MKAAKPPTTRTMRPMRMPRTLSARFTYDASTKRGAQLISPRPRAQSESFEEQESALLPCLLVDGVHGLEQALGLDQPRLVAAVDVEDEGEVLLGQVATDRRVVAAALAEERPAVKVDRVADRRIVAARQ